MLSGIFIGIAGTVYLAVPNPLLGAFLFGFGLLTIVCYGFKLYTGAIGYLALQPLRQLTEYLVTLSIIYLGNLAGTFAVGTLVRQTRTAPGLIARAEQLCQLKLQDSMLSLLILGFFCGILMYLAVETYRRREELAPLFRFAMVILCVAVFILCGFEHCIANMYYFSAAGVWSAHAWAALLVMTLGNSLGGMFLALLERYRRSEA